MKKFLNWKIMPLPYRPFRIRGNRCDKIRDGKNGDIGRFLQLIYNFKSQDYILPFFRCVGHVLLDAVKQVLRDRGELAGQPSVVRFRAGHDDAY